VMRAGCLRPGKPLRSLRGREITKATNSAGDLGDRIRETCMDTEGLVERASRGDGAAVQLLLAGHRDRLRRMVAVRLDRRLAARLDPSDVVQEAMVDATQRLSEYLLTRPVSFYPWLRQLVWERLVKLHRHHIDTGKRSVRCEAAPLPSPGDSALERVAFLLASGVGQVSQVLRAELCARVRGALDHLDEPDREILVMRYLERLSTRETAQSLGISEGAVKMRHLRALDRIRPLLREYIPRGDAWTT
jgi:RNA polymerase sigma-70 factor, ECF subfamily